MKIAILVSNGKSSKISGAEKFACIVCENINKKKKHQADLIRVDISKEINNDTFFYKDLNQYDLVVWDKSLVIKEHCSQNNLYVEESNIFLDIPPGAKRKENFVVPSGVDTTKIKFVSAEKRRLNKLKKGIGEEKIALSMGSLNSNDIDGVEKILNIASSCPNIKFMLMGAQCENFRYRDLPKNVGLLGKVNDRESAEVMSAVDFAINPLTQGKEGSTRTLEYMAAGIPVISSSFDAAVIGKKELLTIADTEEELINSVKTFEFSNKSTQIQEARTYVERIFDWHVLAENFEKKLEEYLAQIKNPLQ